MALGELRPGQGCVPVALAGEEKEGPSSWDIIASLALFLDLNPYK